MFKDYLFLAIGNLKHRGLRSWLTMLGIFIGIAAVVALISLGQGLQNAVTAQFGSLSADTLIVQNAQTSFGPPGASSVRKLTSHDIDIISSVAGIKDIVPRILRMGDVLYNKKVSFKYIASLPEAQKSIDIIYVSADLRIEEGRLLSAGDRKKVLLGHDFIAKDEFNKEIKVGSKLTIKGQEFEVAGILKEASTFEINGAILMPERDMKDIFNLGDESDFLVVRVSDKNQIQTIASQIEEKLRKDRKEKADEEDFTIQTPVQAISTINTILTIINVIVVGMALISLFIGGVGIANTMYTSVLERTNEIGVMKAVGGKNSDVRWIFLIESGLLGLIGGVIGAIIGILMALSVSWIAKSYLGSNLLAVTISWPLLILSVSFSLFIGIIFGLLPSIQASKLRPVEALRQ